MNIFTKKNVPVIVACVAIVLAVAIFFSLSRSTNAPLAPAATNQNQTATSTPATSAPNQTAPATKPATTYTQPQSYIKVTSPALGDQWAINQIHTIAWNPAAGSPGGIYLVNAATKATVGWILPSTGANQNYYQWDTRDYYTSRYVPTKINLQPGNYVIKITFAASALPDIASSVFSVTPAAQ